MNIAPNKAIPVSYSVLPTETTTYFVQAVLRDTASGAVLQTLNLTQSAAYLYRYSGAFKPVSDASGLGRYIDITIIPYTDAGYTTPSQNYGALQLNYVVLQPWLPTLGSGGASGIDYEKLEGLLKKHKPGRDAALAKAVAKIPTDAVDYGRIGEVVHGIVGRHADAIMSHSLSVGDLLGRAIAELKASGSAEGAGHKQELIELLTGLRNDVTSHAHKSLGALDGAKRELMTGMNGIGANISNIHEQAAKKIEGGVTKSLSDSLLKTIGKKEVHVHLGGSQAPQEATKSGFDMEHVRGLLT